MRNPRVIGEQDLKEAVEAGMKDQDALKATIKAARDDSKKDEGKK